MKVTGIYLLATSAAIGAKAQVLKGSASSFNPRPRRNVMKEADRRRLQTQTQTEIPCVGIDQSGVDGYGGFGCVQQAGPIDCTGNESFCKSNDVGYNECFNDVTGATTCVCIIPDPDVPSNNCNGNYGAQSAKPSCFEG